MKKLGYILILFWLGVTHAQTTFEAVLSKKTMGLNERLKIEFKINKNGDNFKPPAFHNFKIIGGPSTSISNYWVNGKRSFSKSYTYVLSPIKKGKFQIGSASIVIDGQVHQSRPKPITVTSEVKNPSEGENSVFVANEKIHLVAEVSNYSPYVNEAITVVYRLYVAFDTGVSNWLQKENPRYNDFWSHNIEVTNFTPERRMYKGKEYRSVVVRKSVLYPQKSGSLKIEPLSVNLTVSVPTNRQDWFGSRISENVNKVISAGSRTINVKPLPEKGKPSNFSGAVGKFDFEVTTSKNELNANESLQATVKVSGKGNLKLFNLPKLKTPGTLEVYDPEHKENVKTYLGGMRGSVEDKYTIVPQFKGKYPLPILSFSYFDLETKTYKTLSSDELILNVPNGPENNHISSETPADTNGITNAISTNNQAFAFIKTKTSFEEIGNQEFFKSSLFWSLLLMPILLIPIAIFGKKQFDNRLADVELLHRRKSDKLAKKYLSTAQKSIGDKEEFYISLERSLHNFLKAKLKIKNFDFSKDKIHELLTSKLGANDKVSQFMELLNNCELARYSPFTQTDMEKDIKEATEVIAQIDKQL